MNKQNLINIYNLYQYSNLTESSGEELQYGKNFPYTKNVLKQFLSDLSDLIDCWKYDEEIAKAIVEMISSIKSIAERKQYANAMLLDQKRKDAKDRERERKSRLRDLKHNRH